MIRYLAGVRGAGKTTLVEPLVSALPGFVVLDMDEVLDDDLGVLGVLGVPIACEEGRPHWPAYNRLWVRIAGLVERSQPVLLLGPLLPEEWRAAGGNVDVVFALLDCEDATRVARLGARGYDDDDLDDALRTAAAGRAAIPTRISTESEIEATVAAVLDWLSTEG